MLESSDGPFNSDEETSAILQIGNGDKETKKDSTMGIVPEKGEHYINEASLNIPKIGIISPGSDSDSKTGDSETNLETKNIQVEHSGEINIDKKPEVLYSKTLEIKEEHAKLLNQFIIKDPAKQKIDALESSNTASVPVVKYMITSNLQKYNRAEEENLENEIMVLLNEICNEVDCNIKMDASKGNLFVFKLNEQTGTVSIQSPTGKIMNKLQNEDTTAKSNLKTANVINFNLLRKPRKIEIVTSKTPILKKKPLAKTLKDQIKPKGKRKSDLPLTIEVELTASSQVGKFVLMYYFCNITTNNYYSIWPLFYFLYIS